MQSVTVTITKSQLEGSERFVWAKLAGKHEGREFTATELEVEVSTDPARLPILRIVGPWLTPLAQHDVEYLRINGWEHFYEEYDSEAAAKLPEHVLEVAASAGFVVPVPA